MIYYLYDGSFSGMLTAIYDAFYADDKPDKIIKEKDYQENLFAEKVNIETDKEKSDKVYQAIADKISSKSLRKVYYTYLSEKEDRGTVIYKYLKIGFKVGREIDKYYNNDSVLKLKKLSRKVSGEIHRMLGLLRFKKTAGDIYYASCEPDYNILSLLAPHFARRLADQNWIIHDISRKQAAVFNQKEWVITFFDDDNQIKITAEEKNYQKLWKGFFDSIAIKNRKNLKLQRQLMPERYWKHLIEKD